jgi:hypothetical protein
MSFVKRADAEVQAVVTQYKVLVPCPRCKKMIPLGEKCKYCAKKEEEGL